MQGSHITDLSIRYLISAETEEVAALDFDMCVMVVRLCSSICCCAAGLHSGTQARQVRLIMAIETCLSREPTSL